jgi:hypothetical protein
MDILGKSIIQNYLDMGVVFLYCTAQVQKHGTHIHRRDVDERAVFVSAHVLISRHSSCSSARGGEFIYHIFIN